MNSVLPYGAVREGAKGILKAFAKTCAQNAAIKDTSIISFKQKGHLALEASSIYNRDIRNNQELLSMPLDAATLGDDLGTLSGTLVAQRTLELFRNEFPVISQITTDFSDTPGQFGQVDKTRIVITPAVQEYDPTTDASGRPNGWATVARSQAIDVPIVLDKHVGVPIVFDSNTLGSTLRNLFEEQAPAAAYALSKYFIEKIYALITPANFNAYAAVADKVPVAYATYHKALADFGRSCFVDANTIFNPNEVPLNNRFALLNSQYYGKASNDPSLVTFFAGQQAPEIISDATLPKQARFTPIEAPNFPSSNNRVGFFGHKAAIVTKSRLSNDINQMLGAAASNGSVTTMTNAETGFSVSLVQYANHTGGYAEWRLQVMLGAAVGDKRGGLVITN